MIGICLNSFNFAKTLSLRPHPHVSGYFLIRAVFFPDWKISTSTRIHPYSDRSCPSTPHVSDTYSDSLWYPGLLWEYCQQSMNTVFTGLDLVTSSDKKISRFSVWTIHSVFRNFHSGERILSQLRVRMPDSPDTCGRKPDPERKSCGLKNIRIRVHRA